MFVTVAYRIKSLIGRVGGVFRSRQIETDLREELQSHIDMRTELLIARGATRDSARFEALQHFGNRTLVQEEARRQELVPQLESVVQDLEYGARLLRRNPGFTVVALLTLGLGIGLNTAMFSVFHHTLLAPLQFTDPDRLYVVSSRATSLGDARRAASGPDFRDYRAQNTVF